MSFEDGLRLVKLRGESMQAAADAVKSGMVSVIGLDSDKVPGRVCVVCSVLCCVVFVCWRAPRGRRLRCIS